MTGMAKSVDRLGILAASGNQHAAPGSERLNKNAEPLRDIIQLPRSFPGGVAFRPEIGLGADSLFLWFAQSIVRVDISRAVTQSRGR